MLNLDTLVRLHNERKCIFSTKILADEECLISKHAFPRFYKRESDKEEIVALEQIIQIIPSILLKDPSQNLRNDIKKFMQSVLKHGSLHNEDFIHKFLFEYWEDVCKEQTGIVFKEKYFKGDSTESLNETETHFYKNIVKKVYKGKTHVPDIIGVCDQPFKCVYVIDIKNQSLDDRSLGQILRYYQVVRSICDKYDQRYHSYKVIPVLMAIDGSLSGGLQYWYTIPFHFREILDIYFWFATADGLIELRNGKSHFRQNSKNHIS